MREQKKKGIRGVTWTEWQINFLKENYGKMKRTQLAKRLNKTIGQLDYTARKLGLMKPARNGQLPHYLIPILEEGKKRGLIK